MRVSLIFACRMNVHLSLSIHHSSPPLYYKISILQHNEHWRRCNAYFTSAASAFDSHVWGCVCVCVHDEPILYYYIAFITQLSNFMLCGACVRFSMDMASVWRRWRGGVLGDFVLSKCYAFKRRAPHIAPVKVCAFQLLYSSLRMSSVFHRYVRPSVCQLIKKKLKLKKASNLMDVQHILIQIEESLDERGRQK